MFGSKTSKIEKLVARKKSDLLVQYVGDKDIPIRLAAIKGLGEAGGEAAFNSLTSLLRDPNASVREAAARALGVLKDPKSGAFLSARLKEETDTAAKEAMSHAIKAVQGRL